MALLTKRLFQLRVPALRSFSTKSLNWDGLVANSLTNETKQDILLMKAQFDEITVLAEEYSKPLEPIDFQYYRSQLNNSPVFDFLENTFALLQNDTVFDSNHSIPDSQTSSAFLREEAMNKLFKQYKIQEMLDSITESSYTPETLQLIKDNFMEELKTDILKYLEDSYEEQKDCPTLHEANEFFDKQFEALKEEVKEDKIRLKNLADQTSVFKKHRTTGETTNTEIFMLYPATVQNQSQDSFLPKYPKKYPVSFIDPEEDNVPPFDLSEIDSKELTSVPIDPAFEKFYEENKEYFTDNTDRRLPPKH